MNSWTQNPKSKEGLANTLPSVARWRGLCILSLYPENISGWIDSLLARPGVVRIATVNAEFLVQAARSRNFLRSLRSATVCVADGVGIRLLYRASDHWQGRVTGRAVAAELLSRANLPICILVPTDGLQSAEALETKLRTLYPQAQVRVVAYGERVMNYELGIMNNEGNKEMEEEGKRFKQDELCRLTAGARVVLLTHGAPTQEYLAQALQSRTDGVAQLVVAVGGALDVLSGALPTPPAIFTTLGLEWLYRLVQQPRRLPRIYQSVVVYPWLVLVGWYTRGRGTEAEE